jgi:acetyl esterase/lipase
MPSWQSHLLRITQRGFRFFYGQFTGLDVVQERQNAATAERLFKPSPAVQYSSVTTNSVPAKWVVPVGLSTEQVVLYVHGSGFYAGALSGARPVEENIAQAGKARVLTIAYRLTPEHPFPAALVDTRSAYEWLLANNVSPKSIVLVGDSAGGTLVLALLVQLRGQGRPMPRGAICLSPTTDLTMSGETWVSNTGKDLLLNPEKIRAAIGLYLQNTDPRDPLASPLYADLHGLPPLLTLVGSDEYLLSDSTRLAAKAQAAGVSVTLEIWDRMQHGWHILAPFLPEGQQALARIGQFMAWEK